MSSLLFLHLILAYVDGSTADTSARIMAWVEGGRKVVSSVYSPDNSVQIDSTVPGRIGLRVNVDRSTVITSATIVSAYVNYRGMVQNCASRGMRLASPEEVIYACIKGLVASCSGTVETAEIYRVVNVPSTFRTIAVNNGSQITGGTETWANTTRTFMCVK